MDVLHRPEHPQLGVDLNGVPGDRHHQNQGDGGPDHLEPGVALNRFGVAFVVFFGSMHQHRPGHHRNHAEEHEGAHAGFEAEQAIDQGRRI
jgi:hypothetical protein